jgi:phospholipid/cholesterol/gamma-HCH transport system ATP-binding protein
VTGTSDAIIRVENLQAGFGGRLILDDISFEVKRGEILVILGGSGSGKSTLLKHMIGLYRASAGHVWIEGGDMVEATGEERRRLLRRIGVM